MLPTRCATCWACGATPAPGRCATRCSASPPNPAASLVILREQESPRALADAVQGLEPRDACAAGSAQQSVLRTYGIGAQILKDLGVRRMRVLSAPKQLQGISAFDLEVAEYVGQRQPLGTMPNYRIIDGACAAAARAKARRARPRRGAMWRSWRRASMPTSSTRWSSGAHGGLGAAGR